MLFCFILTFRTFQPIENNFTFEDIFKHFFSHLSTFVFIIEHLVLHLQRENITTFKMRNVNHLQYKDEHKHLMLFTSSLTVLKFIPTMWLPSPFHPATPLLWLWFLPPSSFSSSSLGLNTQTNRHAQQRNMLLPSLWPMSLFPPNSSIKSQNPAWDTDGWSSWIPHLPYLAHLISRDSWNWKLRPQSMFWVWMIPFGWIPRQRNWRAIKYPFSFVLGTCGKLRILMPL